MEYAICTVSAAPLRKEPSHKSEMVSQLLFGETMQVVEEEKEWLQVKCLYDNYEGWLTHHLVSEIDGEIALAESKYVSTGLLNSVILSDQFINLSMGSSLIGFDEETRLLWNSHYKYHGTYRNIELPPSVDLLWQTIYPWMNAPYLWGGRTFMGVDCSGFVQIVFKVLGITLQRDAYQQAGQGEAIENLLEAKVGDIAFFNNEQGRITHVGIILNNKQIIHASGKVRVDGITEEGIINRETGKRTHQLHSIKTII
ncbi:MAG: C40 family peptidase [Chitinophagaceae bacterium]|nr:C40 family peptidase [Chitinophagaceae bacterium]